MLTLECQRQSDRRIVCHQGLAHKSSMCTFAFFVTAMEPKPQTLNPGQRPARGFEGAAEIGPEVMLRVGFRA